MKAVLPQHPSQGLVQSHMSDRQGEATVLMRLRLSGDCSGSLWKPLRDGVAWFMCGGPAANPTCDICEATPKHQAGEKHGVVEVPHKRGVHHVSHMADSVGGEDRNSKVQDPAGNGGNMQALSRGRAPNQGVWERSKRENTAGHILTWSPLPMQPPLWGLQAGVVQGLYFAQPTASAAGPHAAPSACQPPGCLGKLQLLLRCRLHGLQPLGHIGDRSRCHGTSLGVCQAKLAEVGPGTQAVMRWQQGHHSVL